MEKFNTAKAGFKVGDEVVLINDNAITMRFMDIENERVDVLVGGDVVVTDQGLADATNIAKRIADPNYKATTTFHTPREWATQEGVRLVNLIEGNTKTNGTNVLGAQGNRTRKTEVKAQVCGSCFVAMPLVGGCPTCD